jgi:hypothetical protein
VITIGPMFTSDVGVVLEATIDLGDFDATDATAELWAVPFPNQPGAAADEGPRAMDLPGPYYDVASYTTVADDFTAGNWLCQVRLTKGGVVLNTELFRLVVEQGI